MVRKLHVKFRRVEAGWHTAEIRNLEPTRALHIYLTRSMDGPGWTAEAAMSDVRFLPTIAEIPEPAIAAARRFIHDAELDQGECRTLGDLKAKIESAAKEIRLYGAVKQDGENS